MRVGLGYWICGDFMVDVNNHDPLVSDLPDPDFVPNIDLPNDHM